MTRPHLWIRAEVRPTEQRVPIVPADAAEFDAPVRSVDARRPSIPIPRNASNAIRHAALTTQQSATLNTGQCGNSRKSTTCPCSGAGARKSRSVRFPATPAARKPSASAQPRCSTRRPRTNTTNASTWFPVVDGDFTIKTLQIHHQQVVLHPENPAYPDVVVGGLSELVVWGVVVHSIRHLRPVGRSA